MARGVIVEQDGITTEFEGRSERAAADRPNRLRLIARNVVWNWLGTATAMACGFFVAPFLIHRLGDTGYGLWIVIGSLAGYFTVLDFGVRGSIGRHIALHRAHGDARSVTQTFNAALVIMLCVGTASLAATTTVGFFWLKAFHVPAEYTASARLAFLLVSVNLSLSFPLQVFEGTLWGHQRFDALNWVDIPTVLLRSGLSLYFVGAGHGLVALAAITLIMGVANGFAKIWFSFRESKAIRVNLGQADAASVRTLFRYGRWNFIILLARMTRAQLSPLAISTLLNVAFVTPYAVARRLQDYAYTTLWTATGVLTPVATGFHATDDQARQRRLMVEGGRWCLAAGIYFWTLFLFLGETLIRMWMGQRFAYTWTFLIILASGELLAMSQLVTSNILFAMAKHRPLAILGIIELSSALILVTLLSTLFGLVGVCVGFALAQTVFSGVATLYFGCRATGVRMSDYLSESILPVLPVVFIPAVLLGATAHLFPATTWLALVAIGFAYTAVYWGVLLACFQCRKTNNPAVMLPVAMNWLDGRLRSVLQGLR